MNLTISGLLKGVSIKPGALDEKTGVREPARAVVQLEVPVTRSLGRLGLFVGQDVDVTVESAQLEMDLGGEGDGD